MATCGLSSLTGGGQKKLRINPRFNYKSSRAPDRVDFPTLPSVPGSCEIIFLELTLKVLINKSETRSWVRKSLLIWQHSPMTQDSIP